MKNISKNIFIYILKLLISLLVGTIGILLIWSFIGRPITLNYYFSKHNVTYMEISQINSDSTLVNSKELSKEEIDDFLKKFGSYKIYDPLFRRSSKTKQDDSHITIALSDPAKKFNVIFPLSDQGSVGLVFYIFYPYNTKHMDMYNHLSNLLDPLQ